MKLRIEISGDGNQEVVIRCPAINDEVIRIQNAVIAACGASEELVLSLGDAECFVPVGSILFFETDGDRVAAHTASAMYSTDKKLYELERALPHTFLRVSKSCILNSALVSSIARQFAGSGEVLFYNSNKKAYASRMYYPALKNLIYETRLSK